MKKKLFWIIIIVFVIIIVLLGAYFYFYPKKAQNLLVPEVDQVEKIRIKIVGDTARLELGLKLENKGPFKMNIDSIIYRIKFDTATLLSRAQHLKVVLKSGQSDTFMLPVRLPFRRLMAQIQRVQNQDSVPILTDITIVYSTIFGKASLPYKKTNVIAVPIPPKFELLELEYTGRNKRTLYFNLHLRMENPGRIELRVSNLNYDLKMEDLFTANGKYVKSIKVSPRSTVVRSIPIEVHLEKGFKTLIKMVSKDKVNYEIRISGEVEADKLGKEKTVVEISKNGNTVLRK
jgi:LEA14-like dessication related protein